MPRDCRAIGRLVRAGAHGVDILVREETRRVLDRRFRLRAMPPLEVKGLSGPVLTYAVEAFDADAPRTE